ncbi:galactose ABC superfamily ATP binding cassette transporter, membrane protein [Treponema paraluiscuniculi Cuniculi A]|uniref:Galactose ABC superfamily ATP binding cassette transporter, membrane protein n=1 Tax=Treponema paraluiscuniculi (strain Cuniculi A) TaxID=545776 RepID=F7XTB3_TREPU|nr:galactoside ABC transporter permease [Treponema paraluiscuniculi]AEH40616.1 galactose ABC superfamily ATP binding cassette transporter, membrane protein [Treponema paraluiscuniculi Cuniculi A]
MRDRTQCVEVPTQAFNEILDQDGQLTAYAQKLEQLRERGSHRVALLRGELARIRQDQVLGMPEKRVQVAAHRLKISEAQAVARQCKTEETQLVRKAVARVRGLFRDFDCSVRDAMREQRLLLKQVATVQHTSASSDQREHCLAQLRQCKEARHHAYRSLVERSAALRNGKMTFIERVVRALREYSFNFDATQFFLANGLYIAIAVFFIACIVVAPFSGNGNLLTIPNILTILEQSSVRMFYAVGVAGIILLAGTDLSIGRMVAMGSVVTGIILHPGQNIVTFFGLGPWDFTPVPMAVRVVMSLAVSVALCVSFSLFAGFFSARLKIHPFISTLATQLIIYGVLFFGTSGTPVGSIDPYIKDLFGGRWILGTMQGTLVTFPKLIIPATIAVAIAWFIWNKTILGKNMYAVGGNAEAANVSGISVFGVTMSVFAMAAVFYGFGAFFETFKANASAGTGQGYELDAIASCVVGGISFNGGIGKLEGAVVGVIIFTGLTYCLTFLGIDTNLQFVFKGLIIIAAVALDSVKYLKRR